MRKIKFRAWGKKEKKMFDTVEIHYSAFVLQYYRLGETYCYDEDGHEEFGVDFGPEHYYPDDVVLLQFTGLLDKNKKEIYEGDIVKEKRNVRAVFWNGNGFWCLSKTKPTEWDIENSLGEYITRGKGVEVIGNIYLNKELLNE